MKIAPFPELRTLAEEEARAHYTAWLAAMSLGTYGWDDLDAGTREVHVAVYIALLTDLTRRASFLVVADLAAKKARITVFALHALISGTAPYPPEWPPDLCDKVATADTEAEALAAIVGALWGGA